MYVPEAREIIFSYVRMAHDHVLHGRYEMGGSGLSFSIHSRPSSYVNCLDVICVHPVVKWKKGRQSP